MDMCDSGQRLAEFISVHWEYVISIKLSRVTGIVQSFFLKEKENFSNYNGEKF